jgi:hypothetical protein
MTPGPTKPEELADCPFCGAGGEYRVTENRLWQGMKYGSLISLQIMHWCPKLPGAVHAMREVRGRDEASAIAQWNRRP